MVWSWSWPSIDNEQGAHPIVATTFQDVLGLLTSQTSSVVLHCHASMMALDRLEEHLHVMHDMLSREQSYAIREQSRLLSELWTMLGGNRQRLWSIDQRLDLLQNMGDYRLRALAHVGRTLELVQSMGEDMEELRTRVATPALVEDRIPIEVQLLALKAAIDRISEGRIAARERIATIEDAGRFRSSGV